MDEVAADATVLIFLGKLRRLEWLRNRYDRVVIPPVVDDEAVREIARLLGLQPRGVLSVLFAALDRDELDFDGLLAQLERLTDHGFHLDEAVSLEAVRRARAIDDR